MITIPMTVSSSQVEVPMGVSALNAGVDMSLGAAYNMTSVESNLPPGGHTGDLLAKKTDEDYSVEWITPANDVEQDNTRPITAAAVYTTVGNINALLATI